MYSACTVSVSAIHVYRDHCTLHFAPADVQTAMPFRYSRPVPERVPLLEKARGRGPGPGDCELCSTDTVFMDAFAKASLASGFRRAVMWGDNDKRQMSSPLFCPPSLEGRPRRLPRQIATSMPPLSVLSWNCLADAYSPPTSTWAARRTLIARALTAASADIVTLQEVDHYHDFYRPLLRSLGYTVVYAARPTRTDGVLIAVKPPLRIVQTHHVHMDDLALGTRPGRHNSKLRRRNVALILLVEAGHLVFTLATAHLYWHPACPHVKLAQARYLLRRLSFVRMDNGMPPPASIVTGDFNSLPGSETYRSLTDGLGFPVVTGKCIAGAADRALNGLAVRRQVRFICDRSLSRLARWLRLLGIDAALANESAGKAGVDSLFDRARREERVLVTTSTTMVKRATSPESFLIKPGKMAQLENCLAELLNHYSVRLEERKFLTMCGKCGGQITKGTGDFDKLIHEDDDGGEVDYPKDRELFVCGECGQVYWESMSENGCSVKARKLAKRLYRAVEQGRRAGVESVRRRARCSSEVQGLLKDCSCTVEDGVDRRKSRRYERNELWLRYESACKAVHGREPEYTNVNGDFRGTLDYIFVGGIAKVATVEVVDEVEDGEWPSDHMMVKARLYFEKLPAGRIGFARTWSCPKW